jgi:YVTN family beta-propeller protein
VGEPTGRFLYAANTRADRVEVLDLSTREVLCPIRVGAGPVGLDVGSDGSRLYTANSDGSISVVDTASRHEVRRVPVPDLYGDEQPLGLAVASNGKALITTGPSYGSWGSVMELDTSSLQVRTRYDVNRLYNGRLRASADRSTIGLVGCGVSDGPLIVYRAGTDSFQEERNLHGLTCDVALSRTGSSLLVGPSTRVVSSTSLDMRGSFTGYSEYGGVAWRPSYSTGFRLSSPGRVDVLDLTRFLVAGHLTLPDTTTYAGSGGIGRMTVTPDGRTLAVLTDRGIAVLTLSSLPSAPTCAKPASGMSSTGLARLPSFAGDVAIDRQRAFAYISHPERNQVEVLNLSTGAFDCPILVGSSPQALDLSPDGTSLYTANSGGNNISVVDVATRQEVRKRRVPYGWLNETPRSLAAAANGRVLITMTCCGSGRLPVWEFSPSSDTVRHRADALGDGYATTWTWLKANADRSAIGIAMGDSRPATAGAYRSAGDTFVGRSDIPSFIGSAAVSADGSRLLVNPGTYVFDEVMASRGTIAEGYYGVAFAPAGLTAYRVGPTGVQVVSADTGVVQRTLALPDTLTAATNHSPVGRITVSADGQLLAVTTDHGVAFLTP